MEKYNFNVSGINQTVEYVNGPYAGNNMGMWIEKESKIFISDELKDEVKFQTILHELCHVFFKYASLKDGDDEERIVSGMSVQFYDFLVKNKEFVVDLINNSAKSKNNA